MDCEAMIVARHTSTIMGVYTGPGTDDQKAVRTRCGRSRRKAACPR